MANNTLTTNFNVAPYYDDYNEDSNFYRILFKPSLAVQARELTQLQTMLQKQIDRFGEHVFKEGSLVSGGEFIFDTQLNYLKIRNDDINEVPVNVQNLLNQTIVDTNTGLTALVVRVLDGDDNTDEPKTVYIKYQNTGSNGDRVFPNNQFLVSSNGITIQSVNEDATGFTMAFKVGRGVLFAKDHFVLFPAQEVLLARYSQTPTCRVGLDIGEEIINFLQDITLVDPANGSPNFGAPGADRLRLRGSLVSLPIDEDVSDDFRLLFEMENGSINTIVDKPEYAELAKEFARRTYDESGNYVVRGLGVLTKDHLNNGDNNGYLSLADGGNSSLMVATVDAGKAYVYGFEYSNRNRKYLTLEKGIDFVHAEQQVVSLNYGNYVSVNEVAGTWNMSNNAIVELYDTAQQKVSNGTFSLTAPSGSKIGEAKIKAFTYEQGIPGSGDAQYRLYLNEITMTANTPFSEVRSFHVANTTIGSAKASAFADAILQANSAVLKEPNFNRNIFNLPARFVRNLRSKTNTVNTNYTFFKTFDVAISANGSFSVSSTANNEVFEAVGLYNNTLKREIFLTFHNSANVTLTGTGAVASANNVLEGFGTSFTTEISPGDRINVNGSVSVVVDSVVNNTNLVLAEPAASSANGSLTQLLTKGMVMNLDRPSSVVDAVGPNDLEANFGFASTMSNSANASMTIKMNVIDAREKKKTIVRDRYVIINTDTHPNGVNGPWKLGFADVLGVKEVRLNNGSFSSLTDGAVIDSLEFDNGQTDSVYNHAFLARRPGQAALASGSQLLVKLDLFTHDLSQGLGYFSVDSYPIDDVNPANTSAIQTYEIPLHVSKTTGVAYDLRDSIDFRPAEVNTAALANTIGTISTNPPRSGFYNSVSGEVGIPYPNENFITDMSYFLPRKDAVTLDSRGTYSIIRGVPSLFPITPKSPDDAMTLAVLEIAPYPSLTQEVANKIGRPELASRTVPVDNRRYTMRDIGVLDQRLKNVEYYTSISLLEKETANIKILDANGLDRFKNGFIVDSFTGHNVGAVKDPDYNIAIDPKRRELRPRFELNSIPSSVNLNSSNNVTLSTNDVTITVADDEIFTEGGTVFQGTTGSETAVGFIRHKVGNKLYVERLSGSFSSASSLRVSNTSFEAISNIYRPKEGHLLSLPYTQRRFARQRFASDTRNTAGVFWLWKGTLSLNPDNDYWVDTESVPPVRVNIDGNLDAWENLASAWGTQWGSWDTLWSSQSVEEITTFGTQANQFGGRTDGTVTEQFTTTSTQQRRSGSQLQVSATQVDQNLGENVIDTNIIPHIRSRTIACNAVGLKPNTRFYVFFDGVAVSQFCSPAVANAAGEVISSGLQGDPIVSDNNGNAVFLFVIPNSDALRFNVGTRVLRITDSATNSRVQGSTVSSAEAEYNASGLVQTKQDTILSTQQVNLSTVMVSETRTEQSRNLTGVSVVFPDPPAPVINWADSGDGGGMAGSNDTDGGGDGDGDPVAQSVLINIPVASLQGVFLTKAVFYFNKKHSFLPVTLEVRAMENGIVTRKRVPYGQVTLFPENVNVSSDGSVPTPFYFETPVFLSNNEEYALILKPEANNPDYEIFVSRLGELDLQTEARIIQQPYVGVMYVSSNDIIYNALQDETAKFEVYCAQFQPLEGLARIEPTNVEFANVSNTSGVFHIDEIVLSQGNVTFSSVVNGPLAIGTTMVGADSGAQGEIIDIVANTAVFAPLNAKEFEIGESFTVANSSTTGTIQDLIQGKAKIYQQNLEDGTLWLYASENRLVPDGKLLGVNSGTTSVIDSFYDIRYNLIKPNASFLTFNNTRLEFTHKSTSNAYVVEETFLPFEINSNIEMNNERLIVSRQNEIDLMGGAKSLQVNARLRSANDYQSPVIDMQRFNNILVHNIINNDDTGETLPSGGNAKARYITRTVTLRDGLDAEDLKVYLGAYRPFGTNVKVYCKILHREDSDRFRDRPWIEMTESASQTFSSIEDKDNFIDIEYDIPEVEKNEGIVEYSNSNGTVFSGYKYFAIKIVLLSGNSARIPKVRDLRAIALQK